MGYLALAGRFPLESSDSGASVSPNSTLATKEAARLRKMPARIGEAVETDLQRRRSVLQWEQLPGRLFMRIEEKRPPRP